MIATIALPCRLGIPCALDALERALTLGPRSAEEQRDAFEALWSEEARLEHSDPAIAPAVRRARA